MTRGSQQVDVTVVVVTWNSRRHIAGLVESLPAGMQGLDWRLVVVDNDSSDDTVALAREAWPEATVHEMGRNAGYAASFNAAVRATAPARAYLILNPDVSLSPGCGAELFHALQEPGVGMTVPRLTDEQGGLQLSQRRDPSVARAFGEALLGGSRAGRMDRLGEVVVDHAAYRSVREVDWATGAVMLMSRECLERVGEWEESYFLYSEETDFSIRTRAEGFAIRYCPDAEAVHIGGDSHISPALYSLLSLNRVRLFRRFNGPVRALGFEVGVLLGELLRARNPVHRAALTTLASPRRRRDVAAGP
jgi:GT2 family glycosyltransferase